MFIGPAKPDWGRGGDWLDLPVGIECNQSFYLIVYEFKTLCFVHTGGFCHDWGQLLFQPVNLIKLLLHYFSLCRGECNKQYTRQPDGRLAADFLIIIEDKQTLIVRQCQWNSTLATDRNDRNGVDGVIFLSFQYLRKLVNLSSPVRVQPDSFA